MHLARSHVYSSANLKYHGHLLTQIIEHKKNINSTMPIVSSAIPNDDFIRTSFLLLRLLRILPGPPVERLPLVPVHLGRVHVGRALRVGLCQQGEDGQQHLLHGLHRAPALVLALVVVWVVARGVEDGDAHPAGPGVHVGVEDGGGEPHSGRFDGVIPGNKERIDASSSSCNASPPTLGS